MEVAEASPEWAIGFEDECWWSRVALPTLNAWSADDEPLRLVQRVAGVAARIGHLAAVEHHSKAAPDPVAAFSMPESRRPTCPTSS